MKGYVFLVGGFIAVGLVPPVDGYGNYKLDCVVSKQRCAIFSI